MDEHYYDNHYADKAGVVVGVPPWLREIDYTDDITGVNAVFDLHELYKGVRARDAVCYVYKFGIMQLAVGDYSYQNNLVTRLCFNRFYRYLHNGQLKMKIVSLTPLMLSDRSWVMQIMYKLVDKIEKNSLSKLYVGNIVLTPPSSQTTTVPEFRHDKVLVVSVTGSPEDLEQYRAAGTFRIEPQLTTVQTLVGRRSDSTGDPSFFGRLFGTSKHRDVKVNNNTTIEDTLLRIGAISKTKEQSDKTADLDLL